MTVLSKPSPCVSAGCRRLASDRTQTKHRPERVRGVHGRDLNLPVVDDVHKTSRPKCKACPVKKGSTADSVRRCVDVLIDVLTVHGFDDTGFLRRGCYDFYSRLCRESYDGDWMKMMKDKIACFFSWVVAGWDGVKPVYPPYKESKVAGSVAFSPSVILGGRAYRYIRFLKRDDPELFRSVAISFLYSKKGMPRPGKRYLTKATADTFMKLTTPKPESGLSLIAPLGRSLRPWADVKEEDKCPLFLTKLEFARCAQSIVDEIFDTPYTDAERLRLVFPSLSANYTKTRALLGTLGSLEEAGLLQGSTPPIDFHVVGSGRSERVVVDDTALRSRYLDLYTDACEYAVRERKDTELLALPEALKVRVISKGPPVTYWVLTALQKFVHSQMRRHKTFQLIGRPVDADLLQSVVGKLKWNEYLHSIDYSDATNELHEWTARILAPMLAEKLALTPDESSLLLTSLVGHWIDNPGDGGKRPKPLPAVTSEMLGGLFDEGPVLSAPQMAGQLMGSITSFLFLCLANATVCKLAFQCERNKVEPLKSLPLVINGDDGLFRSTSGVKHYWSIISDACGLKESVGKVYSSRVYANINSTSFEYYPDGWEGYLCDREDFGVVHRVPRVRHYRLIPYVNMGLLYGLKRSGGAVGGADVGDRYSSVGARASALLSLSPEGLRKKVYTMFLAKNWKRLTAMSCGRVPWFLPTGLGGLGLPALELPSGRGVPSDLDLRLARKIHDHPDRFAVPRPMDENLVQTWAFASEKMRSAPLVRVMHSAQENGGGVGYATVVMLFVMQSIFGSAAVRIFADHVEAESPDSGYWYGDVENITPSEYRAAFGSYASAFLAAIKSPPEEVALASLRDRVLYVTREVFLNRLRKLWSKVMADKTIAIPEPYSRQNLPAKQPSVDDLGSGFFLASDLPFGFLTGCR